MLLVIAVNFFIASGFIGGGGTNAPRRAGEPISSNNHQNRIGTTAHHK
jgi:hypothetical protein